MSVLNSLTKTQLNRYKKFIDSPYLNTNRAINLLTEYVLLTKNISQGGIELEPFLNFCKQNDISKYTEKKHILKLVSDSLLMVNDFLVHEELKEKPLLRSTLLLEHVRKNEIKDLYNSTISKSLRNRERNLQKSGDYYYQLFKLEKNLFELTSEFERKSQSKKELKGFNVQHTSELLDQFYAIEKLKLACTSLSWKRISKHETKLDFIPEIQNYIKNNKNHSNPIVEIFFLMHQTLLHPEQDKIYYLLKHKVAEYHTSFSNIELRDIYEGLINYCIQKVNSGQNEFQEELFNIYDKAIDSGAIFTNNKLSPTTYRNISFIGLRLKKYDWVENFIHSYKEYISAEFRENAVTFNLARLYFYKKEYDKVIEYLREVIYEDLVYVLSSKILLVAAYYETNEVVPLYSLIDSFRLFINRTKTIPQARKSNYLNFLKHTKKLSKLTKYDTKAIERLETNVKESKSIVNKSWVLEKIQELKT